MEFNLMKNSVNQISKGTIIYQKDEEVSSVCLILKGRIEATNNGAKVILGSGSFIGLCDFYMDRYLNSYIAYDDVTFYCFDLEQKDELDGPFLHNNDYKGLATSSLVKYINEINSIYYSLSMRVKQLHEFIIDTYEEYNSLASRLGYEIISIPGMNSIEAYASDYTLDTKKVLYYKDFSKFTLDQWKSFCSAGNSITPYLIEDMSNHIINISVELSDMVDYIISIFPLLINQGNSCLFKNFATLAIKVDEAGGSSKEILELIDAILEQINVTEKLYEEKIGQTLEVDRTRMEEIYFLLLSKGSSRKEQVETNFKFTVEEQRVVDADLEHALNKILNYSGLEEERKESFKTLLNDFRNLRDKNSIDDSIRSLRRKIADLYYMVYEGVFFRSMTDNKVPKVITLFLKYGLLDETFLTKDQLRELYYLEDSKKEVEYSKVYNILEWLTLIYQGKKEPSKNEFDMDYTDTLRQKRKRGELSEAEERVLQVDTLSKVSYEIHNMFRYNNRIVNGQISTFIPFLYGENIVQNIKRLHVDSDRVNQVIKSIVDVDYSLFYREELYVNPEAKIVKEYIMEEYYPDIILMPTVGSNGIMWQDISGKKKASSGRFILPQFSDIQLRDLMIKLCGKFRWELCRSVQGTAWNNIKYKSLTSEYADYIQFYRKNKELSQEVREKVKAQIQKGKGNYREIFVLDYEAWIKNELTGALRLNRVAREILATYCPFAKSIRERLSNQPMFVDAMSRNHRENLKKVKELDQKYKAIEKDGSTITKELVQTLAFYREL